MHISSIITNTTSMDYLLIGNILKIMWYILIITVIYNEVKNNMGKMGAMLSDYDKNITGPEIINNYNNTSMLYTCENETIYLENVNINYKINNLYMQ